MKQIGELALGAFGGALAVRSSTEKVLGPIHNEGFKGYAVNIGFALFYGWLGAKFISPVVGGGILAGGGGTIVQRFWDEHVSKLVPVAALTISGGETQGKGLGDMSYSDIGTENLKGYYEAVYMPRSTMGARLGAGGGGGVSSRHLDAISA
jgi:hypothetical protein